MSNDQTTAAEDVSHESCVRLVVRARNIMRSILAADERGQGVNFHEAMDAAEAFCCDVEARLERVLKEPLL